MVTMRRSHACNLHLQERERAATFHRGPFLVVMRPQGAPKQKQEVPPSPGSTTAVREAAVTFFEGGDLQGGHEAPLVPVPLPLGSVRVSLGAYSTFEDCYALVSAYCRGRQEDRQRGRKS